MTLKVQPLSQIVGFQPARRPVRMMPAPFIAKRAAELKAFRIAPNDSNYSACMLDPLADGVSFTLVVEFFEPGGKAPPNTHAIVEEAFFVMGGLARPRRMEKAVTSAAATCWSSALYRAQ
jgi:hypothetical protein